MPASWSPNRWTAVAALLAVATIALSGVIAALIWPPHLPAWDYTMFFWAVATGLFGGAIGFSELIARYKDNPLQSLATWSAMVYVAVNVLAAVFAYVLIRDFGLTFGAPPVYLEWIRAFVAGFSAMVFFRSSIFQAKIGDASVAIGPGVVFQILLAATDRACDRKRGMSRSVIVHELMDGVSFSKASVALPSFCFALMQNISAEEQAQVGLVTDSIKSSSLPDDVKTYRLGLMLLNLVGEETLHSAVTALSTSIKEPAKMITLDIDVYPILQRMTYSTHANTLLTYCFNMAAFGSDAEREQAKQRAIFEITREIDPVALGNSASMTLLGLLLLRKVGSDVLRAALVQIPTAAPSGSSAAAAQQAGSTTAPVAAAPPSPPITPPQTGALPAAATGAANPPAPPDQSSANVVPFDTTAARQEGQESGDPETEMPDADEHKTG